MEMGVSLSWFLHGVDPRKAGLNCRAFSGSLGWWDVTDIVMYTGFHINGDLFPNCSKARSILFHSGCAALLLVLLMFY